MATVYKRMFQLWVYTVGHGQLLLRNTKSVAFSTRIDILFKDVVALSLPTTFDELVVAEATADSVGLVPAALQGRSVWSLLRFAGVLSAHATLRRHVVPRTSPVDPNPQSPWQSMLPFTDAPALKPAPPLDPAELSKALGAAAAERAHDRPPATPSRHLWA